MNEVEQNIGSPTPSRAPQPEPTKSKGGFFAEVVRFAIIALVIVLPIRIFIAQPFIVSGASMDPTFETGEYLIVNQLSYRLGNPARGDVAIFKFPQDTSKYFIKRVIGLPGETVELDGTSVIIKNTQNPDGFKLSEPYISQKNKKEDIMIIKLKADQYFVMGDNRRESSDSRSWGTLSRNLIVGKPFVRLFPIGKISFEPGSFNEPQ